MAVERHLSRAPITEALIDFRVSLPEGTTLDKIEEAGRRMGEGYYRKSPIYQRQISLSFDAEQLSAGPGTSQILGVRMHSHDNRYVAQLTRTGVTVSRLEPYETWDRLRSEARRLWDVFHSCTQPLKITRVATRFINNLRLPIRPGEPFEDFLVKPPQVPEGLPSLTSSFLQRMVVHDPDCDAGVILTLLMESAPTEGLFPVILDIDVFRTAELEVGGDEAWSDLESLRRLKNDFFFQSLTEKAIESYL